MEPMDALIGLDVMDELDTGLLTLLTLAFSGSPKPRSGLVAI